MNIVLVGDDRAVVERLCTVLAQTSHTVLRVALSPGAVGPLGDRADICFVLVNASPIALRLNIAKLRRQFARRFPLLAVIQRENGGELSHALAAGADDFLVWPRDPSFLKARLALVQRRFFRGLGPQEPSHQTPAHGLPALNISAIQAAQGQLRALLCALPDRVLLLNTQGVVKDFHGDAATSGRFAHAVGSSVDDLFEPETARRYREAIAASMVSEPGAPPVEVRHGLSWRGSDTPTPVVATFVRAQANELLVVLRKDQAGPELAAEPARAAKADADAHFLHKVALALPMQLVVYRADDGEVVYLNRGLDTALGLTVEGWRGTSLTRLYDVIHPADLVTVKARVGDWRAATDDSVIVSRFRLRMPDESWRWFVSREVVFRRDERGHPYEIIGVLSDVTLRRNAELQLKSSEERLRLALGGRQDVVYEWSATDGVVHFYAADPSMTPLMPATRDAWEQAIHLEDRPLVASAMAAHMRAGVPFSQTYRLRLNDGRWRHVIDRASAVPASGSDPNDPIRWIGVVTDITERVEDQHRLSRDQKMEAMAHLAGGLAEDFHRLLTDLNRTLTDGLRYVEDAAGQHALTRAREAAEEATTMTRQLAAFGRRQVLQPEYIALPDVLADAADRLDARLGPRFRLDLASDAHVGRVLADPVQMEQVVWTLLQRARRTMPKGGAITVEVSSVRMSAEFARLPDKAAPGRYVKVEVRDSGTGVPEDLIKHVFDPFFSAQEGGADTGLAVPMAWSIVDQHEGFIVARNLPTGGASFAFYLPVVARPPAGLRRNPSQPLGGTETVLLVDDDEMIRRMARRMLESAGYQVMVARDGLMGLQTFERNMDAIDLVILDVVMPRLGGRAVFERMMMLSPHTAYMFMSGYSMTLEDSDFVQRHSPQFLAKPFNTGQLLRSVRTALEQRLDAGASAAVVLPS